MLPSDGGLITPPLFVAMRERVQELAARPGAIWTDQFNNPDNRAGYRAMAEELLAQTGGRIDAFVMGVGTGGCLSGNAEVLKERLRSVTCVAVEPAASRALSGGPLGGHRIEGIGAGFVGAITRTDLIDEIVAVGDDDAAATARRLARQEGVFAGTSAAANVTAALDLARRLGPGRRVVTVAPDSGLKYLQGDLYA